jgi:hypothetical protein
MVLQVGNKKPELCLGGIALSLPPQCGGPQVEGWDWDEVEGEESAAGTTWGDYEVTGYYDGKSLTLLSAGPPQSGDSPEHDIGTPCEVPEGGWERPDPGLATGSDLQRTMKVAREEPDFAGEWIDYVNKPTENDLGEPEYTDPKDTIINIAFSADLGTHERKARETWGGPLCVSQLPRTYDSLRGIQNELTEEARRTFGLELLSASVDVTRNVVEISVTVIDSATQQKLDERYGEGVVVVDAALEPID